MENGGVAASSRPADEHDGRLAATFQPSERLPGCTGAAPGFCLFVLLAFALAPSAQTLPGASQPPVAAQPAPPADALGRATPRGAVLGFLNAARRGMITEKTAAQHVAELDEKLLAVTAGDHGVEQER